MGGGERNQTVLAPGTLFEASRTRRPVDNCVRLPRRRVRPRASLRVGCDRLAAPKSSRELPETAVGSLADEGRPKPGIFLKRTPGASAAHGSIPYPDGSASPVVSTPRYF